MTMGGGYIFTASVTASFYQSSEFRVYSSLTRQTDQESPISLSWRATASFYHTGASFGIEGIHLDGSHSLDVAYGVECEEAKSQVQRHRLPVPRLFGLAVTDEGRRRLQWAPSTSSLFFGGIGWGDIVSLWDSPSPSAGVLTLVRLDLRSTGSCVRQEQKRSYIEDTTLSWLDRLQHYKLVGPVTDHDKIKNRREC